MIENTVYTTRLTPLCRGFYQIVKGQTTQDTFTPEVLNLKVHKILNKQVQR